MKKRPSSILLLLLVFIMCIPIIFVFTSSFMSFDEVRESFEMILGENVSRFIHWRIIPRNPSLRSYVAIFFDTPSFFVTFWNTIKIVIGILVLQLLFGMPIAWGLAKLKFPCKKVILGVYIILMILPFQVRMVSEYLVLQNLNLLDSYFAVIFPSGFSTFPVFIMYNFFKSVPDEVIEAARIDGASDLYIFLKIAVPLGKGGIISALVLGFFEYWNILEQPMLFLEDKTLWPLSLYIPNMNLGNVHIIFSSAVLIMVPSIIIFILGQEYLEQGIVKSVVEGGEYEKKKNN